MKAMTMYRPRTIQGFFERPGLLGRPNVLDEFDRYFESFFGESPLAPAARVHHLPTVDIRETEKAYALDMELPGYEEKDIEISVDGSSLSVSSKQREEKKDAGDDNRKTWLLRERRVRSFSRSFKLPENANPSEVSAEFKNGMLCMEIKKREEAMKRTITINAK